MDRQPVESSSLASVGYDKEAQILEIEFQHGGVYQYAGVPGDIHYLLMVAPSKGQAFWRLIRDRFPHRKA